MTLLPVTGAFSVTAVYGQKGSLWRDGHKGIDFAADDRRVYATCNGTVRLVAFDEGGWASISPSATTRAEDTFSAIW